MTETNNYGDAIRDFVVRVHLTGGDIKLDVDEDLRRGGMSLLLPTCWVEVIGDGEHFDIMMAGDGRVLRVYHDDIPFPVPGPEHPEGYLMDRLQEVADILTDSIWTAPAEIEDLYDGEAFLAQGDLDHLNSLRRGARDIVVKMAQYVLACRKGYREGKGT